MAHTASAAHPAPAEANQFGSPWPDTEGLCSWPDQPGVNDAPWLLPLDGFRRFSELRQRLVGQSGIDTEKAAWACLAWGTEIFLRRTLQAIARRAPLPASLGRNRSDFFVAFSTGLNPLMQSYVAVLSRISARIEENIRSDRRDVAYLTLAQGSISLNFPKVALWAVSRPVIEHGLPEAACGILLRTLLISEGHATLNPALAGCHEVMSREICDQSLDILGGGWGQFYVRYRAVLEEASFEKSWDEFLRTYRL